MRLGRMRLWVAIGSGCGLAATLTGAIVLADEDTPEVAVTTAAAAGHQISAAMAGDAEKYWTSKRMAAATPLEGRPSQSAPGLRAQAKRKNAAAYGGIPTVGALFFNNGGGDHYCTASVVNSRSKKLLMTAAHCLHGGKGRRYHSRVAFVPKYDRGRRPYGIWTAKMLLVDRRWIARTDADLDFGFIALNPRNGRRIQGVVGANRLAVNRGYRNTVNVTGYPQVRFDRRDRPIWCRTTTRKQSRFQIRMECGGFHGGTSGSPWLVNYDSRTRTGGINGVIGGFRGGGTVNWISYSSYFDGDARKLKDLADRRA